MDKLFIHLFTVYMEQYQDTQGALREVDFILNTDYDVLYLKLQEAIQQAHRIRIFRENKIGLSYSDIGEPINTQNIPEDVLKRLLEVQVDITELKKFIGKQISNRGKI